MLDIIGIVLILTFAIVLFLYQSVHHERKIGEKISELGGNIIKLERKYFSYGPLKWEIGDKTVNRIEYEINGEYYEGWVKFGGLMGPDWRL